MNKKRADEQALRDARRRQSRAQGEVRRRLGPDRHGAAAPAAVQPRARVLRERPRHLHAVLHARAHAGPLGRRERASRTASGCRSTPTRARPRSSGRWPRPRRSIRASSRPSSRPRLAVMQRAARRRQRARASRSWPARRRRTRAAELVAGTKMGDAADAQGAASPAARPRSTASTDPMIALARLVDRARPRAAHQVRQRSARRRARRLREDRAGGVRGAGRRGVSRRHLHAAAVVRPVKGYMENGKTVTPFTEIRGLYVRGDEHKQKPPYKIADSWMKARGDAQARPRPSTSSPPTTSSAATADRR